MFIKSGYLENTKVDFGDFDAKETYIKTENEKSYTIEDFMFITNQLLKDSESEFMM